MEVVYTIAWSSALGLVKINASFDLVTVSNSLITTTVIRPEQTFETRWREAAGHKQSVKFSGNPGYIVGQPIRAGKLRGCVPCIICLLLTESFEIFDFFVPFI